jgi:hypothetical protein
MEEAADDAAWSQWTKMLFFAIRGTIMLMLPWGRAASILGHAVAGAAEKAFEFGMETGVEGAQHHEQESALKDRGAELIKLAAAVSEAVGPNVGKALTPVSQGEFYRDRLTHAPLSELQKFRLPYLIPTPDESQLRTTLADLMSGFAHAQKPTSEDNRINVELVAAPTGEFVKGRAVFKGSDAFAKELKGHPVGAMHHVPVDIRLTGGIPRDDLRWHPRACSETSADYSRTMAGEAGCGSRSSTARSSPTAPAIIRRAASKSTSRSRSWAIPASTPTCS